MRFFRKYEWIPTVFMLSAIALFLVLGGWQIQRKQWKENILAQIEAAQHMLPLTQIPANGDELLTQEYRKVQIAGTYFPEKTLFLGGRFRDGEGGYFVLTPLHIKGDKRAILVNRGFIPSTLRKTFEEFKYNGLTVPIEGIVRLPKEKKKFLPDNSPESNVWFWEDIDAMEKKTKLSLLPAIIEIVSKEEQKDYPLPSRGRINIRNDHLGYAITWFSMALVGIVMFGLYRRSVKKQKAQA